MATRKIIIYQKYSTKPIILTDNSNRTKEEIHLDILKVLESDKISILVTSTDSVIVRPSEIQSVLISDMINDGPEFTDKKIKTAYDKKLELEEPAK